MRAVFFHYTGLVDPTCTRCSFSPISFSYSGSVDNSALFCPGLPLEATQVAMLGDIDWLLNINRVLTRLCTLSSSTLVLF